MTRNLTDLMPVLRLFVAERRHGLLLGAMMSAVTVMAGIALLGLSGWFITSAAISGLTIATAITFDVFAPSAGIRLLAIGRTIARYGERMTTHDATLSVLAALRERLFLGWAVAGNARNLAARPSRLLFRLTADVDALDSLYLRVLVPATVALCTAVVTCIALGLIHPLLGASIGAVLLLAGLGIPYFAGRRSAPFARCRMHGVEVLRSRVIDLVAGQTDLLMANRVEAQRAAIDRADAHIAEADDHINRIEIMVSFSFGIISALLLAGTLLAVVALVERETIGAPVAALGLLVAFTALEPFAALRRGAIELGRTLVAARRVSARLVDPERPVRVAVPPDDQAFVLSDISARHYGARLDNVRQVTLSLAAGDILAVVGASGAGKSALLSLLAGEMDVASGHVAVADATLMTQRTELFADTIRGNLLVANPAACEDDLRAALSAAGLNEVVDALPQRLDTQLGEGGVGLSGGQLRRLALGRLFLRDAPLWLLDEPTEGLDGDLARDVMRRIKTGSKGRSLVIASHLRREAEMADRLVVIQKGRIGTMLWRGQEGFDLALARLRPD
ncbi:amino acid ABC transporter ATP-binding/permease protein [Agrobacterium tumefaciens]|uniref:amino acid ABC transporter ATP-binding/permease protein n=1 Tax=Agrobacterium tumefaciens TaxID=358 RepID=UPI003BA11501